MGADMIALVIPVKNGTEFPTEDKIDSILAAWQARFDELYPTEDDRDRFILEHYMDDYSTEEIPEVVKGRLADAIQSLSLTRQWDLAFCPTHALWVTGGMTWGDGPTDAYDAWSRVLDIDIDDTIWTACGFGWTDDTQT